jgi:hypothetical protein
VGVVTSAGDGVVVMPGGPGAGVAGVAGEVADGVAELLVGCPAQGDCLCLAGWGGGGGDAGQAGEGLWSGEARAAVADLGEQPGGADGAGARQRGEDVRVRRAGRAARRSGRSVP